MWCVGVMVLGIGVVGGVWVRVVCRGAGVWVRVVLCVGGGVYVVPVIWWHLVLSPPGGV